MTPITREEIYLAKLGGQDVETPSPITRIERYLDIICGSSAEIPVPVTRIEHYLAKIAGIDIAVPAPILRIEYYLAAIAGLDIAVPEPVTRIEYFLYDWLNAGPPSVVVTVTGVSPLALVNALAKPIKSLTQYGKCGQKETDLPSSYKRVLGFSCDNNAMWEITGFKLRGSDTVRISFSINGACNVFGCYQGADANDNYDLYVSTTSGSKYFRYGNGTYLSYWSSSNLGQRFDVVYTPTGSRGMPQDSAWSELTFESANNLLIGSTTLTGSSSKLKGNLYGSIVVDGRLNLIPCERVSDGVLGYYDTYSATFYEPYTGFDGAVSLGYATVPSPDTPQGIVCNNGVVHVSEQGIYTDGTPEVLKLAPIGSATQDGVPSPTNCVPVKGTPCGSTELLAIGDEMDTYDPDTQTITRVIGSVVLDGTESFGKSTAYGTAWYINAASSAWGANRNKAVLCTHFENGEASSSSPNGTCFFNSTGHFYFRASEFADAAAFKSWVKDQYDAGTPVVVYFVKSTPTTEAYTGEPVGAVVTDIPALLRVYDPTYGDKMDEFDIVSGVVTRKVGYHVFTGEETLYASDSFGGTVRMNGAQSSWGSTLGAPVCTHFLGVYARSSGTANVGECFFNSYGHFYFRVADNNVDTFKAWLAAQYAAGTPVIIFYQLATETTEQTTAHSLNTSAGDNVVSVASEVDPVELEAEYTAAEAS